MVRFVRAGCPTTLNDNVSRRLARPAATAAAAGSIAAPSSAVDGAAAAPGAGTTARRLTAATRALWLLVVGLLALYLAVFAMTAAGRLLRPDEEFVYGESWLLDDARRVADGLPLYAPVDRLPLMHTAYTPVYYVVVGGLEHVFGDTGYTTGRWVSLIATMLGTAALGYAVRLLTSKWRYGLLACAFFLTQNLTLLLWAPLHRADALALGLTLAGLAVFTRGSTLLAAVLFVLATMTKQTFLVAPLAAFIALWPKRTEMVRFAALFGGLMLGSLAVAQWLTGGWFLWHTVVGNSNEAEFDTFAQLMGSFLQFNGLPVLAAAASLFLPSCPAERVWRLYFLGSLATLPTIAKIGASSNYWLETTAASAVLLGLGWYRLHRAWSMTGVKELRLIAPTVIAGALLIAMPGYQATAREATDSLREGLTRSSYMTLVSDVGTAPYRVQRSFVDRVAAEPGDLLTDNPGLAVAAGKPILYEFQIFQLLYVEGRWSEQPILEAIRARRFSLVAVMHPLDGPAHGTRWTPSIREALLGAYRAVGPQSGFWLYRPN